MAKQKNILFLMTDQQRPDFVGWHPQSRIAMPNLDRLAEGTTFNRCVTVNPICAPARSALLTGKYTHQIGMCAMSGDLSRQHPTMPRALQQAGYWTAAVGKLHYLQTWPFSTDMGQGLDLVAMEEHLKQFGYDHIWEASGKQLCRKNRCHYAAHLEAKGLMPRYIEDVSLRQEQERNEGWQDMETFVDGDAFPLPEEDYVDIVTADRIIDALTARPKDKPFYMLASFCGPHPPYDPPQRYLDAVPYEEVDDFAPAVDEELDPVWKKRWYKLRRAYRAMINCLDDQVGRVMQTLEDEGLLDDTVIVFTSDHGEMLGDRRMSGKAVPWEASCTVPTAIRHPDHLTGKRVDSMIENIDLTATMLDAAGLDPHEALSKNWPSFHNVVPSKSLMPLVRGETDAVREAAFSECSNYWQMVETTRYKYVRYLWETTPDGASEKLFDKQADPHCLHDVASNPAHAEALASCRRYREYIMDKTPPAQTRWARYRGEDGSEII